MARARAWVNKHKQKKRVRSTSPWNRSMTHNITTRTNTRTRRHLCKYRINLPHNVYLCTWRTCKPRRSALMSLHRAAPTEVGGLGRNPHCAHKWSNTNLKSIKSHTPVSVWLPIIYVRVRVLRTPKMTVLCARPTHSLVTRAHAAGWLTCENATACHPAGNWWGIVRTWIFKNNVLLGGWTPCNNFPLSIRITGVRYPLNIFHIYGGATTVDR